MKMIKIYLIVGIALLGNSLFAADFYKTQVSPSYDLALSWVKKNPLPPPHFAHLIALASECGERALKMNSYEKPFTLAFLLTLENLEPKWKGIVEEGLKTNLLSEKNLRNSIQLINKIEQNWIARKKENLSMALKAEWINDLEEGQWRPTPPKFAQPVLPEWSKLLNFEDIFFEKLTNDLAPNHILSPAYYADLDEVLSLGSKSHSDKRLEKIAKFWAAGSGTVTPPGMWLQATHRSLLLDFTLNDSQKLSIMRGLSTSLSLAGITCWKIKYKHNTWRPISAIRETGLDLGWTSRLETPPFPSYVSGHSTFSAAAATFLKAFGVNHLMFTDETGQTKMFNNPWTAALEAGKSRIYGGIHFEKDNRDGLELGRRVACQTLMTMKRSCL